MVLVPEGQPQFPRNAALLVDGALHVPMVLLDFRPQFVKLLHGFDEVPVLGADGDSQFSEHSVLRLAVQLDAVPCRRIIFITDGGTQVEHGVRRQAQELERRVFRFRGKQEFFHAVKDFPHALFGSRELQVLRQDAVDEPRAVRPVLVR